jgi:2-polyprenyl-6-methoxyphenol hydroxylase-like FAD-dependent oxidoreductase
VFEHLGVLEHACQLGAKVTGLEGQLADGRLLVNSHYHEAGNHYTGLGIHRATLCHVLQTAVNQHRDAITWYMGYDIQQLQESPEQVRLIGQDAQQHPFDAAFDAVIVANGARSQLRPSAWVKIDQPYPWGAAWTIVPECQQFNREILHQFYDTSQIMMGILPTGRFPLHLNNACPVCSGVCQVHNCQIFFSRSSSVSFGSSKCPSVGAKPQTGLSKSLKHHRPRGSRHNTAMW